MRPLRGHWFWPIPVLALAFLIASCGTNHQASADKWGNEATDFLDELSNRYAENDFYGILDFYESTSFVEIWRGDLHGGAIIPNILRWNAGDMARRVDSVLLDDNDALELVTWEDSGRASAIIETIAAGRISHEVVYELVDTLRRSLRANPEVIATYTDLYDRYAGAWNDADADEIGDLYSGDAVVTDSLTGLEADGLEKVTTTATPGTLTPFAMSGLAGDSGQTDTRGLFLGPAPYGDDPSRALGVYTTVDSAGCSQQMAVVWQLEQGQIVDEHRYHEVESFRSCHDELPEGWWTGLGLPTPSDEVATDSVTTPGGSQIEVRNGGPMLEQALLGGFARFAAVGLEEPRFDAVAFEPSRKCVNRSGRVIQTGGERVLYICLFEYEVCPQQTACDDVRLSIRATIAHELAHAWMIDQVDRDTESQLLQFSGRTDWDDPGIPWGDRGVEFSAEVMAWGLLADPPRMARIGAPSCDVLLGAFRILTGANPAHDDDSC
ncbi:MAG: hypothetical protein WCA93_13130 [Acidimicrobiia bacterium]